MNEVINFNYEGNEIPFRVNADGEVFMNATVMLKPFPEKRMNNFLRNRETLEFVNALHEESSITPVSVIGESALIQTVRGRGENAGTWLEEVLALRFAQCLNPKFGIWCNKRIQEIITQGFSALTQEATDYIGDQVGIDVEMINEIVLKIQTGDKQLGKAIKAFMRYVEGDTVKIASIMETVHKTTNR